MTERADALQVIEAHGFCVERGKGAEGPLWYLRLPGGGGRRSGPGFPSVTDAANALEITDAWLADAKKFLDGDPGRR